MTVDPSDFLRDGIPDWAGYLEAADTRTPVERVPVRRRVEPPAPSAFDELVRANEQLRRQQDELQRLKTTRDMLPRLVAEAEPKKHEHPNDRANRRVRRARESAARADKHCTALLERWFPEGVPDGQPLPPYLPRELYARGRAIASDPSGRVAREAMAGLLPHPQQVELLYALTASAQLSRIRQAHRITRADIRETRDALDHTDPVDLATLTRESRYALTTVHGRRFVQGAVAMWTLARHVPPSGRQASRGRVRMVEGYCREAIAWGCPTWDGRMLSTSALWGPHGVFSLLGAESRALYREPGELGEAGLGLYTRWQPRAWEPGVRHVGPIRRDDDGRIRLDPKTGLPIQWAVAMAGYDKDMCGRTAVERVRMGDAAARSLLEDLESGRAADVEEMPVELLEQPPAVSEEVSAALADALGGRIVKSGPEAARPPPD